MFIRLNSWDLVKFNPWNLLFIPALLIAYYLGKLLPKVIREKL